MSTAIADALGSIPTDEFISLLGEAVVDVEQIITNRAHTYASKNGQLKLTMQLVTNSFQPFGRFS